MNGRLRLPTLLALVLLAAVVSWLLGDVAGPVRPAVEPVHPPAANPAGDASRDPARPRGARELVDDAGGASFGRGIDRDRDLHGVVIDPAAEPLAGAEVLVFGSEALGYHLLDLALGSQRREVARTSTDGRGRFVVPLPPGRPFSVEARAPGLVVARRPACYAGELVTLQLSVGAVLRGRVTRAADGAPVEDARVFGNRQRARDGMPEGPRSRVELFAGYTGADGSFRFEGLEPLAISLSVLHPWSATPRSVDLELHAGEETVHDFALGRGAVIHGRVTDAVTGLPIAGADVGEGWSYSKSVRTDATGQYAFPAFSDAYASLHARARGYGEKEVRVRPRGKGELLTTCDFALSPARRARGRALDADGPVAGVYVAAVASDYGGDDQQQRTDWQAGRTRADGAFELEDLRPDVHHVLFLEREGYGTAVYDFPPGEFETHVIDLGDLVLGPAALLRGTLVDDAGQPVPHHPVELRGHNADRDRFTGAPAPGRIHIDGYIARRSARTDDLGRFAFGDLAAGHYEVRASRPGVHRPVSRAVDVVAGERVDGFELVLGRGLSIGGRVSTPDGSPPPTAYVSCDPDQGGTPADIQIAADGSFTISGLEPGAYTLTVYPYQSDDDRRAGRRFASQKVKSVAAGRTDVEIRLTPAAWIRGTVVDADDAPVARALVEARDHEGARLAAASTDADGRFELWVAEGTPVDLAAEQTVEDRKRTAVVRGVLAGTSDAIVRLAR